jgi:hypothetical protein
MRRICGFVPAAIVIGAERSLPEVDVPNRARPDRRHRVDPQIPRVDEVRPCATPRSSTRLSA